MITSITRDSKTIISFFILEHQKTSLKEENLPPTVMRMVHHKFAEVYVFGCAYLSVCNVYVYKFENLNLHA